jgi:hypothetical protein
MSNVADAAAAAPTWRDLAEEFDRWGEAGRVAELWWRDDDAVAATPQLDRLVRLAGATPIGLAVIPALARPDLAAALHGAPRVAVLQHGWQHANRAESGKKSEYPEGRSAAVVEVEIRAGRSRLEAMFGSRALPIFVPPWNRFAAEFLPLLAASGMRRLSTMARGPGITPAAGPGALDVHVDLTDWRGGRDFVGVVAALGRLIGHLRARRLGPGDDAGPIGVLTHHRIMDDPTAMFLERLVALTTGHAAVRWTSAVAEP